jgi:hypothetical protein
VATECVLFHRHYTHLNFAYRYETFEESCKLFTKKSKGPWAELKKPPLLLHKLPTKTCNIGQQKFIMLQETAKNLLKTVRVGVRVTLRLEVYRQSVRLGTKPLEANDQRFCPEFLLHNI